MMEGSFLASASWSLFPGSFFLTMWSKLWSRFRLVMEMGVEMELKLILSVVELSLCVCWCLWHVIYSRGCSWSDGWSSWIYHGCGC